ncbi:adaptor protein MecA [Eupransor demetentiae]|uniref:Adapter protein MecA n=1 Tax=Eupransor demetentiae TaxID=3109584 RepID=A0ABM9N539_9LACO|nr:Negative regulator MecA of genetic competence [Lactobacillaceae bacterium LMG 33000]
MEMERINDHTIRVMIENSDLQDRGTSVRDLLSDRTKIESFFYNILSEVDTEHDFADNDKVSFQILPSSDGLELFISRLDDQNQITDILDNIIQTDRVDKEENEEQIDQLSDDRRTALAGHDSNSVEQESDSLPNDEQLVFTFKDFESLLSLSALLVKSEVASVLYRYEGVFYLSLDYRAGTLSETSFKNQLAEALEYGQKSKLSSAFLAEHADVVYDHDALRQLNKVFA